MRPETTVLETSRAASLAPITFLSKLSSNAAPAPEKYFARPSAISFFKARMPTRTLSHSCSLTEARVPASSKLYLKLEAVKFVSALFGALGVGIRRAGIAGVVGTG